MIPSFFDLNDEVADALNQGRAVVALESTLLAHGLPWPENLQTAHDSEAAVRRQGAVPATIAVLGGRVRIGLDPDDLERIARSGSFLKASRRDLGVVAARGLDAATTVSATLWIARTAGLAVMATGGLGGVHRHAGASFDVSTDLDELARADGCLVVCSGAKSVLDLSATLEALETRGVAVVGYQTNDWPAFTVAKSGLPLEWRAESADDVAAILHAQRALRLPGAVVLAQPVPEAVAMNPDLWNTAEAEARTAAEARGITGKAVTPFLLAHVHRATKGQSLQANRALIVANAALAASVALALADKYREPSASTALPRRAGQGETS